MRFFSELSLGYGLARILVILPKASPVWFLVENAATGEARGAENFYKKGWNYGKKETLSSAGDLSELRLRDDFRYER
jgi:hypothetical protein